VIFLAIKTPPPPPAKTTTAHTHIHTHTHKKKKKQQQKKKKHERWKPKTSNFGESRGRKKKVEKYQHCLPFAIRGDLQPLFACVRSSIQKLPIAAR
jgi:hypothetical protein